MILATMKQAAFDSKAFGGADIWTDTVVNRINEASTLYGKRGYRSKTAQNLADWAMKRSQCTGLLRLMADADLDAEEDKENLLHVMVHTSTRRHRGWDYDVVVQFERLAQSGNHKYVIIKEPFPNNYFKIVDFVKVGDINVYGCGRDGGRVKAGETRVWTSPLLASRSLVCEVLTGGGLVSCDDHVAGGWSIHLPAGGCVRVFVTTRYTRTVVAQWDAVIAAGEETGEDAMDASESEHDVNNFPEINERDDAGKDPAEHSSTRQRSYIEQIQDQDQTICSLRKELEVNKRRMEETLMYVDRLETRLASQCEQRMTAEEEVKKLQEQLAVLAEEKMETDSTIAQLNHKVGRLEREGRRLASNSRPRAATATDGERGRGGRARAPTMLARTGGGRGRGGSGAT